MSYHPRQRKRMHGGFNNFGYQSQQSSVNDNGEHLLNSYTQPNVLQVPPKTFSNNLSTGPMQFEFGTSSDSAWIPDRSYFLFSPRLTVADGGGQPRKPLKYDRMAYTNLMPGEIIQDCRVEVSNRTLAIQNTDTPQCYALYQRLGYGGGFLQNDPDVFFYYPEFGDRCLRTSNQSDRTDAYGTDGIQYSYTTVTATDGIITIIGLTRPEAGLNPKYGLSIGDTVVFWAPTARMGTKFLITDGDANVYTCNLISGNGAINIAATTEVTVIRGSRGQTDDSEENILIAYQPPLGIFQTDSPISANSIRVTLNPFAQWQNRAVQQMFPSMSDNMIDYDRVFPRTYNPISVANSYNVSMDSISFYPYIVKKTVSPDRVLTLKTLETLSTRKEISNSTFNQQFSIPATTRFIAIFFQGVSAESGLNVYNIGGLNEGNRLDQTCFRTPDNNTSSLSVLSINIGSITIPYTDYSQDDTMPLSSKQVAGNSITARNLQLQRFLDCQITTSKFFSDSGTETFQNWMGSPYYVFDIRQQQNSWNTTLNVKGQFTVAPNSGYDSAGNLIQNFGLHVVAFYEKVAELTMESGLLTKLEVADV